jgi:SprT-like protein
MTDGQLQAWVEEISLAAFNLPFRHRARFNPRLRTTGGRYFPRTHEIEISRLHYEKFGKEETDKIIKHELCHYHLHLQNRGYRHRDDDFKRLLAQVGGSRYCSAAAERRREPYKYKLQCQGCGLEYMRKRRVDTRKYVCGRCGGRLRQWKLQETRKANPSGSASDKP